jgi:hypothetical protein
LADVYVRRPIPDVDVGTDCRVHSRVLGLQRVQASASGCAADTGHPGRPAGVSARSQLHLGAAHRRVHADEDADPDLDDHHDADDDHHLAHAHDSVGQHIANVADVTDEHSVAVAGLTANNADQPDAGGGAGSGAVAHAVGMIRAKRDHRYTGVP